MRISDWGSDVCSSDLEVAERVVRVPAIRFARLVRREGGTHADRHAARAKEGMEMAVLAAALLRRVRVVVILRVALVVEDVALRIMIPFVEGALALEDFADDVVTGLAQHAMAFEQIGRAHV